MDTPGKRPLKRKIVMMPGEQGGDISRVFRVGFNAKTLGALAVFLLVTAALVFFAMRPEGPSYAPVGVTAGATAPIAAGDGQSADMPPSPNRPPSIVIASITASDPVASTALQIRYDAVDPDGDRLTFDIRWFVDGALVQTGQSDLLQPGAFRKGSSVYAEIVPADLRTSGSAYKTPPVIIKNSPPQISAVNLVPETAFVGAVVTATPSGTDPDGDPVQYAYQWRVNGRPVVRSNSENTFNTAALRKHDAVSVAVDATDGVSKGGTVVSRDVILQNRKPVFISSPLTAPQGLVYLYRAEAKDPDGDILKYRLGVYPQGMTIDPTSGVVYWELPKGVMYTGKNEASVTIIVEDGDGDYSTQEFVIVLTDYIAY